MAQIQIVDPKEPDKKYKLMDMKTMTEDFAKEKGVPADEVWMPGMDVEGMDVKGADASSSASQHS